MADGSLSRKGGTQMEKRTLGKTGWQAALVGLGCMVFSHVYGTAVDQTAFKVFGGHGAVKN